VIRKLRGPRAGVRVCLLQRPRDAVVQAAARLRCELAQQRLAQLVVREAPAHLADLQDRGVGAGLQPLVQPRLNDAQHRRIDLPPRHRRQKEQRPRRLRDPIQPPLQHRADAAGQHMVRQRALPHRGQAARLLGERAHHLDHEVHVALGLVGDQRDQRGRRRRAEHRAAQLRDVRARQPLQPQHRAARELLG
jgi:hypothetical protein